MTVPRRAALALVLALHGGALADVRRLVTVADTFITPDDPTNDHGGAWQIKVQGPAKLAYLKFDVPELAAPVTRATLVLWTTNASADGGSVFRVPGTDWSEGTGTATTPSATGLRFVDVDRNDDGVLDASDASPLVPAGDPLAAIGPVRRGTSIAVDVTRALGDGPGLYTFALAPSIRDMATYASRESGVAESRPSLLIETDDGPATSTSSTTTTTTAPATTSTSSAATTTTTAPATTSTSSTATTTTTAPATTSTSSTATTTTTAPATSSTATTTSTTVAPTTTAVPVTTTTLPPNAAASGRVAVIAVADSTFDRFTDQPSPVEQQWMRDHFFRILAYPPYFDSRLTWFPDAWAYRDLYAVYPGTLEATHPEWILRDPLGNPLYIPYGCTGGTCPQYAGDPGDPTFRAHWIAVAADVLAQGYRGLLIDDVNLFLSRVGDGSGRATAPLDPRTGNVMTEADWRRYVAEFVEQIRAAFPSVEIVHNAIWYVGDRDPFVARQIAAADAQWLERGVNDGGIVGGGGTYGFDSFLGHLDAIHAAGGATVLSGRGATLAARTYALAAYLLAKRDGDALAHDPGATPADWWADGWEVDLGEATGERYAWAGVWRRDFANGVVLVSPPGAPTQTLPLDVPHRDLTGTVLDRVTLGPASGAVLTRAPGP